MISIHLPDSIREALASVPDSEFEKIRIDYLPGGEALDDSAIVIDDKPEKLKVDLSTVIPVGDWMLTDRGLAYASNVNCPLDVMRFDFYVRRPGAYALCGDISPLSDGETNDFFIRTDANEKFKSFKECSFISPGWFACHIAPKPSPDEYLTIHVRSPSAVSVEIAGLAPGVEIRSLKLKQLGIRND